MVPPPLFATYKLSPANEAFVGYGPAPSSGVYAELAMPDELVTADPAAAPFTENEIGRPLTTWPNWSTSDALNVPGVSNVPAVSPR